jgi:hypothetical protein
LGKWERENQLGLQKTKKNWLDQYKIVQPWNLQFPNCLFHKFT